MIISLILEKLTKKDFKKKFSIFAHFFLVGMIKKKLRKGGFRIKMWSRSYNRIVPKTNGGFILESFKILSSDGLCLYPVNSNISRYRNNNMS